MSLQHLVNPNGMENCVVEHPIRVLGIDLGTTNSTVAEIVFDPAQPEQTLNQCLPLEQPTSTRSHWNPIVPSCVALHDGKEWVGEGARQLQEQASQFGLIPQVNIFHNCKNDMGLQRTYASAPEGYRNASDVSSKLLSFLYREAQKQNRQESATTTVTVPASFQLAQRNDTLKAARTAGISLTSGELLDEPVAAFISYLESHPDIALTTPGQQRTLLVFDFGGGTCDVGLFQLSSNLFKQMDISPMAVSRYHRLGGGDIDQAIFYEVLLPQIIDENGQDDYQFDYGVKKQVLEPAFIRIAEQLKIALCEKIEQRMKKQRLTEIVTQTVSVPGEFSCELADGKELVLTDPTLTLADFNKLLEPFLDQDRLFVKETEYRQTLSIFTPIHDAIGRNNLSTKDIDLCLLVGGSCLIPQVRDALEQFFVNTEILSFDGADAMQTAVAKGAAINALSLALNQRPVIQPVCQETVAIMTATGPVDLVPQQTALPWPSEEGYAKGEILTIPTDSEDEAVNLRVEIVALDNSGKRTLLSEIWEVPPPVRAGEKVQVESRFDLNQTLQLRLVHLERDDVPIYEKQEEHPFTHVANPQKVKIRIEETEEKLRTGAIPEPLWKQTMTDLADDCAELRQYEKAINSLATIMRQNNQPDVGLMNKMALYAGYMGDQKREEQIYRAALEEDPEWGTVWFNLTLLLQKQERLDEAREAIGMAIKGEPTEASYYVLQAQLAKKNDQNFAIILDLADVYASPVDEQSNWELYWSIGAAELRNDAEGVAKIRKLRQRKNTARDDFPSKEDGCLPGVYQGQI